MKTYNQVQASEKLESGSLNGWKSAQGFIGKEFKFKDFKEAINFMVKVGDVAEELNHHPEWSNVYNKVDVKLSTHDAGGVTDKDFQLASRIEEIIKA